MSLECKKFISLFLIFSLMMLSVNLYAKERRGAKLLITKKDGQQIEGELITVKRTSLLLLNTDGKDESIDIADIRIIKIVKKSKFWPGASIGLSILSISAILSPSEGGIFELGSIGALLGGLIGVIAGTDKTIQIEGLTDLEKRKVLDKLRKKARIRDYK